MQMVDIWKRWKRDIDVRFTSLGGDVERSAAFSENDTDGASEGNIVNFANRDGLIPNKMSRERMGIKKRRQSK